MATKTRISEYSSHPDNPLWGQLQDQARHTFVKAPDGTLWVAWISDDSNTLPPWFRVMMAYSLDSGATWTIETAIPNVFPPSAPCPNWDMSLNLVVTSANIPIVIVGARPPNKTLANRSLYITERSAAAPAVGTWRTLDPLDPFSVILPVPTTLGIVVAVVDDSDIIHIIYQFGAGDLYYIYGQQNSWSVPAVVINGNDPDLAIDADGNLILSALDSVTGNYFVQRCVAGVWGPQEYVWPAKAGTWDEQYYSVAVDSHNNIYCTFLDWSTGELMMAFGTIGGGFIIQTVDVPENYLWSPISIDASDNALVFYHPAMTGNIWYADISGGVIGAPVDLGVTLPLPGWSWTNVFSCLVNRTNSPLSAGSFAVYIIEDDPTDNGGENALIYDFSGPPILLPTVQTLPATGVT